MIKFNKNKVFGLFSTAALSTFLFASSCRAVEPVLLGYITIKAISPKINYGHLNNPLIVKENVFYEIPTASHGILYMRFVSNDGEIIGDWTKITDRNSLKAPENEGLYQIQFLIKSDDPGNILNYPNEDFGTLDGSRFSNVFNGLVGDESFNSSGKVIPIVYENNVEVIYDKHESEESNESEESKEFAESNDSSEFDESSEPDASGNLGLENGDDEESKQSESSEFDESNGSSKFDESSEYDASGNLGLENNKDEESKPSESSEDFSEESKNENIHLGENKPDESKQESNISEENRSNVTGNINSEQTDSRNGNSTQDSYASPISSTSDYSSSSQSSNKSSSSKSGSSGSSSSKSEKSSSKSKSSSIKTSEEPSYLLAIMIGSLTISLLCIMEQRKKSKSDESN